MTQPISCDRCRDLLSPYLEGDLGREAASLTADHLASCASCRRQLELLRKTVRLLQSLPQEPPPRRILESVRQAMERPPLGARLWDAVRQAVSIRVLAPAMAAAAAVLFVIVLQHRYPDLGRQVSGIPTPRLVPSQPAVAPPALPPPAPPSPEPVAPPPRADLYRDNKPVAPRQAVPAPVAESAASAPSPAPAPVLVPAETEAADQKSSVRSMADVVAPPPAVEPKAAERPKDERMAPPPAETFIVGREVAAPTSAVEPPPRTEGMPPGSDRDAAIAVSPSTYGDKSDQALDLSMASRTPKGGPTPSYRPAATSRQMAAPAAVGEGDRLRPSAESAKEKTVYRQPGGSAGAMAELDSAAEESRPRPPLPPPPPPPGARMKKEARGFEPAQAPDAVVFAEAPAGYDYLPPIKNRLKKLDGKISDSREAEAGDWRRLIELRRSGRGVDASTTVTMTVKLPGKNLDRLLEFLGSKTSLMILSTDKAAVDKRPAKQAAVLIHIFQINNP